MKYSSSLLQKFITIQDSPHNIANHLTLKSCEIEDVVERKIPETIVIGKVLSCEKHPDADKLSVCQVDCGKAGKFQILCGGANVTADIYVPVALTGTHFAKAGITIEPRKMRGLDSNGMICSKEELDINEDVDLHNIRSLAEDLDDVSDKDLGTPMAKKFPRLDGFVLEVDSKSLTNRPDLTGHRGVATELNAVYDAKEISFSSMKKRYEQFQNNTIQQVLAGSSKAKKKVVGDTEGLNSYILLELNNVEVKASSFFTRLQMIDMGALPRSNWVDFSNLFMLVSGQPVHFFDAAKIDGNVTVRNAKNKEKFVDLFGSEHELISTDVVIADDKKVLALAGIVGGLESGVTEGTQNILVEIANFDPVAVRKTGTRLGLRTDAELRYEKNINPLRSLHCLLLFLDELKYYSKDLGSFDIGGLSYYISPKLKAQSSKQIEVDVKKMEQFIFGKEITGFEKQAEKILKGLGFTGEFKTQHLKLRTPIWRSPADMNIPADIYEEIARIYGYDAIENAPFMSESKAVPYTPYVALQRQLEEILVREFHCNQTETYPWISEKMAEEFGEKAEFLYSIQNPTNPEMPYLRNNMHYGLLSYVAKNSKFFDEFKIFDIGKVWNKKEIVEGEKTKFASSFVKEKMAVGIVMYSKDIKNRDHDPILEAKNMVKIILKDIGITKKIILDKTDSPSFHPKKQANIEIALDNKEKKRIGFVGSFHPLVLQNRKIAENAGVVYIALDMGKMIDLLRSEGEQKYTYETLQDQIVRRDVCFVVDTDKEFGRLIETVKAVPEVKGLEVFDLYQGTNLPAGKKSIAFRIKIIGDGNMTTEQINEIMNKVIKAGEKSGAELRK